jgi:predicted ATPase
VATLRGKPENDGSGADRPPAPPRGLPPRPRTLIGRDDIVVAVRTELAGARLITLTGTGGVGKTSVACAAAAGLVAHYADGVHFVDLSTLAGDGLVVPHLASLLRIPAPSTQPLQSVIDHLRTRRALIVLDSCEHVVAEVCVLVDALLQHCPGIHILATSRETLRAGGECVKRLNPLGIPAQRQPLSAAGALGFPAVALFVERVRAQGVTLELDAPQLALICDVCRHLDGLPLAIELAATRVPALGLDGVAALLPNRLRMLAGGPRRAEARHRTLRATIDWSYDGLDEAEQRMLRTLSVFQASFVMASAEAVCATQGLDAASVQERVSHLVEKSLLSVDLAMGQARYRLLESIRLYAIEKLAAAGELAAAQAAHAQHWHARAGNSAAGGIELPDAAWLRRHSADIPDIRAALEWAFSPAGNATLAIRLSVSSAPFWFKLLLLPELRSHLERAAALAAQTGFADAPVLMRLHAALGDAIFHTNGAAAVVGQALEVALDHAQRADDVAAQLEIVWAMFGNSSTYGDYAGALQSVARVHGILERTAHPAAEPLYERVAALGLHLAGRQAEALAHAQRALAPANVQRAARGATLIYDHRTATSSHYARALWVSGLPEQAMAVVTATSKTAPLLDQPFALGYFLVFSACPVAIWSGDLAAARRFTATLLDVAGEIAFNVWRVSATRLLRATHALASEEAAFDALRDDLLNDPGLTPYSMALLATLDSRLLKAAAFETARRDQPHWATAEIFRVEGERLLGQHGLAAAAAADALFEQALALSRRQGALSWELRAACSWAHLKRRQQQDAAAHARLGEVHGRFREGFATQDLIRARVLLDSLANG